MAYSCRESLKVQTYDWDLGVWVAAERLGGNAIALDLRSPLHEVLERISVVVKLPGQGHLLIPWERFLDDRGHGVRLGLLWSNPIPVGNFPEGWPPWVTT